MTRPTNEQYQTFINYFYGLDNEYTFDNLMYLIRVCFGSFSQFADQFYYEALYPFQDGKSEVGWLKHNAKASGKTWREINEDFFNNYEWSFAINCCAEDSLGAAQTNTFFTLLGRYKVGVHHSEECPEINTYFDEHFHSTMEVILKDHGIKFTESLMKS